MARPMRPTPTMPTRVLACPFVILTSTVWRWAGCASFLAQTAALVVGAGSRKKHGGPVRLSLALQCLTRLAGVAVVLALAAPASAQVSLLSREVQGAMTATGMTWNHSLRPDLSQMREAFAALHAAAPKDGVVVTKDVAYGPYPRNILDVYKPSRGASPTPVVVFVHGGAYVGGDKKYYGNVTTWFARQGVLGVNATYRLAPEAKWPAATEDIAGMVKWTRENATRFGGDPNRI